MIFRLWCRLRWRWQEVQDAVWWHLIRLCSSDVFAAASSEFSDVFFFRSSETVRLIDLLDEAKDRMLVSLQERAAEGKTPLEVPHHACHRVTCVMSMACACALGWRFDRCLSKDWLRSCEVLWSEAEPHLQLHLQLWPYVGHQVRESSSCSWCWCYCNISRNGQGRYCCLSALCLRSCGLYSPQGDIDDYDVKCWVNSHHHHAVLVRREKSVTSKLLLWAHKLCHSLILQVLTNE